MKRIKITKNSLGGYDFNESYNHIPVPKGWAIIPDEMETPNFPFGEVEVAEIDGIMTVTKWTPGIIPEFEPIESKPTQQDIIEA